MQKKLYDLYCGRFYALCRRYSYDESSAQEVLSDGFLRIFEQIDNYRGQGSFEGWMHTIMLRGAIRRFRYDTIHKGKSVEEGRVKTAVVDEEPEAKIDVQNAFLYAMQRLPDIERPIFNLVAVEGYKFEEASSMLEENISTLKSRYYKALERMKRMVRVYLGEDYFDD